MSPETEKNNLLNVQIHRCGCGLRSQKGFDLHWFSYERSEIEWPSEKYVCASLEAAILFSFLREMGQITLRKSTTGTVVNHKEESSLRGEEFVIGGKGRIPTAAAEAGSEEWTCPNV